MFVYTDLILAVNFLWLHVHQSDPVPTWLLSLWALVAASKLTLNYRRTYHFPREKLTKDYDKDDRKQRQPLLSALRWIEREEFAIVVAMLQSSGAIGLLSLCHLRTKC